MPRKSPKDSALVVEMSSATLFSCAKPWQTSRKISCGSLKYSCLWMTVSVPALPTGRSASCARAGIRVAASAPALIAVVRSMARRVNLVFIESSSPS